MRSSQIPLTELTHSFSAFRKELARILCVCFYSHSSLRHYTCPIRSLKVSSEVASFYLAYSGVKDGHGRLYSGDFKRFPFWELLEVIRVTVSSYVA